jgi:hypothetical protein
MAKRTESQITKVDGVQELLKYTKEDDSLVKLSEYVIIPFVKVIQGMSDQELKDEFGEGSVILRPGDTKIIDRKETFLFVPIFFYTLFRKWGDRKDSQMVHETSFDPTSEVAKIARDSERWDEVYEEDIEKPEKEQRHYRYVEHLCFIGEIYGEHDLAGNKCLISFQKGDFRVGRSFASGIKMRKQKVEVDGEAEQIVPVPLWAQVWEFKVSLRDRNENKWWGFDPINPKEVSPIISPDEFQKFHQIYEELCKAHAANMIRIDGEERGFDEEEKESPGESKDF